MSLIETAGLSALAEAEDIITRLRELAVQASSDAITSATNKFGESGEAAQLESEIRINICGSPNLNESSLFFDKMDALVQTGTTSDKKDIVDSLKFSR